VEVVVKPSSAQHKHPEYLQLAQKTFCERFGVLAPHEAVDRHLATIFEWCQCVDYFRSFAPPGALKAASRGSEHEASSHR
jgi:hypothetical protein